MIYTIGHTESYERYFQEQQPDGPMKKGQRENYPGGSVWKFYKDAFKMCPENYSVYGVLADWDNDTESNKHGKFNNLLVDSKLVKLCYEE